MTGAEGAVGNAHLVPAKAGAVNWSLIGSLAVPESPRPCNQSTKLLSLDAMDWFEEKTRMNCNRVGLVRVLET